MSIEDDYARANRTLLQLLLRDEELVMRLRCLRRYLLLSHASFLTHFLDLSHAELRKSTRAVSVVKLQSLLDLALSTDVDDGAERFREDVKITMSSSGLYDWLAKVVNMSADIDAGTGEDRNREDKKGGKDDKKQLQGAGDPRALMQTAY